MSNSEGKKKWKYIVAAILGIIFLVYGLWMLMSGAFNSILYTGLGAIILVITALFYLANDKASPNRVIETTTETTTTETDPVTTTVKETKKEKMKWESYSKIEKAFKLLGILIIIFGLSYVIWVGLSTSDPFMAIGVIGLGSFVVVLAGAFCLSDKWNLHAGEFRKALTISIISVYFSTIAFSNKIVVTNVTSNVTNITNVIGFFNSTGISEVHQWTLVEPVFNNLWAIVIAVIGFYFATNWIELYKK